MQTKDITQELKAIIAQLVDDGKEPSVALVKARLSQPVPMPAIISTIKSWKANKRVPKVEVTSAENLSAEQRIEQLEQQVAALLQRVTKLENQQDEI